MSVLECSLTSEPLLNFRVSVLSGITACAYSSEPPTSQFGAHYITSQLSVVSRLPQPCRRPLSLRNPPVVSMSGKFIRTSIRRSSVLVCVRSRRSPSLVLPENSDRAFPETNQSPVSVVSRVLSIRRMSSPVDHYCNRLQTSETAALQDNVLLMRIA